MIFGRMGGKYPYTNWQNLNLDWILSEVKRLADEWAEYHADWETWKTDTNAAFQSLHDYVMNYFANLDVSDEISDKLNQMAADGSLSALINPLIPDLVTNWLNEHITPTSPAIDNSLSVSGAGADAKVTGDNIRFLTKNLMNYNAYSLLGFRKTSLTSNGITFTSNGDGSYNVSGTATARANYNLLNNVNELPTGFEINKPFEVYYNGANKVNLQCFKYVNGVLASSSFVNVVGDYSEEPFVGVVPNDATGILIRLSVLYGTVIDDIISVEPFVLSTFSNKELSSKIEAIETDTNNNSNFIEKNKSFNSFNIMPINLNDGSHNGITYESNKDGTYNVSGETSSSRSWYNIYTNINGFPNGITPGRTIKFYYNGYEEIQLQIFKYVNGELIASPVVASFYGDYSIDGYDVNIPQDATGLLIRLSVPANTLVSGERVVEPIYLNTLSNKDITERIATLLDNRVNVKYCAFGDSLTYGAVWDNVQSTPSYRADFINQIPTRIANAIGSNDFVNYGVGGSRFVAREVGEITIGDKIKSVDLALYDIITIGGGRNDSNTSLGDGDTATANDGTICGALAEIFEYLNANYPELQIVMYGVTPQPTTEAHAPSDIYTRIFGGGWSLNTYYTEMAKLCKRYGVAFIDWYDCTLILQWGQLSGGYSSGTRNWSHPLNQNIYKQMGNYLAGKVSSMYKG